MSTTSPLAVPIPTIGELNQNAARLLQQSLAQSTQAGIGADLSATDLELARSNIKALAFVQAVGLHGAYRYLRDFIARQAVPVTSAGQFLDGWLSTYGMSRKEAAAALGLVAGTGVAGAPLAVGTLMQAADGRQFRTTASALVTIGGTLAASVVATQEGLAGNAEAGTQLVLVASVSGVNATFTVGSDGISGGADAETDSEAIYRLQQRLGNEPRGGSPADYARWALELPGVTRAWGVRNPAGPTSAGVIVMADSNVPPGLPTVGQQRMVLDYIRDPRRGPPDELLVIAPDPVLHNYVIRLIPDTSAIRAGVRAALQDLYFREATPGAAMPHSHVVEVISGVTGENNHAVLSPQLTPGGVFAVDTFDQLLVLGTVSFA